MGVAALVRDWVVDRADDPVAVREFCLEHDLTKAVLDSTDLIQSHFLSFCTISLSLQCSPELPYGKLVIDVKTHREIEDAVKRYLSFVDEWTRVIPVSAQEKISVTFSAV